MKSKRTYECPHNHLEIYGCDQLIYCTFCKEFLFSNEEITQEEMKLNKLHTKPQKMQQNGLKQKLRLSHPKPTHTNTKEEINK